MTIDPHTRPTDPPGCTFDMYGIAEPEGEWAYELDDHGITYGYGSWPYYRDGQPCSIRLAPNIAFLSWRNHYVLVNPTGDHTARARLALYVRPQGMGAIVHQTSIDLDLLADTSTIPDTCPPQLREQAAAKARRILHHLTTARAAREHHRHPATAHDRHQAAQAQYAASQTTQEPA